METFEARGLVVVGAAVGFLGLLLTGAISYARSMWHTTQDLRQ